MNRRTLAKIERTRRDFLSLTKIFFWISVGSVLLAFSYNTFVIPFGLLSGGISGLALMGNYLFNFPVYLGIGLLNLPLFIWGLIELDRRFILYSLVGMCVLILALPLTKPFTPQVDLDLFLAAMVAGVVGGIGGGIVFRCGASGGGTDIAGMIMKKKINLSIGSFSFYVNIVILGLFLFFFSPKIVMYTAFSIWVGGRVTDFVIDGPNRNKAVTIISDKGEEIAKRIMIDLNRGVTFLNGEGAYSGESKKVINSVVNNYELAKVRALVLEIDKKAFMYVNDTAEVLGKGYTWYR